VARVRRITDSQALLTEFSKRWGAHRLITEWVVLLFKEFDPANLPGDQQSQYNIKDKTTLTAMCHRLFKSAAFDSVKDALMTSIRELVRRDREGEVVDRCVKHDAACCSYTWCSRGRSLVTVLASCVDAFRCAATSSRRRLTCTS
jgi:hypothetical protein